MRPLTLISLIFLLLCFVLSSCNSEETRFRRLQNQWRKMERQHPQHPETMPLEQWQEESLFVDETLETLEKLEPALIKSKNWKMVVAYQNQLRIAQRTLKKQAKDPAIYDLKPQLQHILAQKEWTVAERSDKIVTLLTNASAYFSLAKSKLQEPDSSACIQAIEKQVKCVAFLQKQLPNALQSLPEFEKQSWQQLISSSILEIQDYIAWCRWRAFEPG
jgi:hypothetical protein